MGAVLIEGVKGCGKTATARQRASSEVLLDTDPEAERRAAIDPRLLLDGHTPRLLDEWQRTPRVWDAVRRAVDDRGVPGQFILTGSATPSDDVQRHSGAGRFGVVRMRTMTLTEKQATDPAVSVACFSVSVMVRIRTTPNRPAPECRWTSSLGVADPVRMN